MNTFKPSYASTLEQQEYNDLHHIDTPPCPTPQNIQGPPSRRCPNCGYVLTEDAQAQCNLEYAAFLEAHKIRLENAIREALYWMDQGAGNSRDRAWACLQQAITGH